MVSQTFTLSLSPHLPTQKLLLYSYQITTIHDARKLQQVQYHHPEQ